MKSSLQAAFILGSDRETPQAKMGVVVESVLILQVLRSGVFYLCTPVFFMSFCITSLHLILYNISPPHFV